MNAPRVLSVGQCSLDRGQMSRFLREAFGAQTESVGTADEALRSLRAGAYSLLLVNRIFDRDGDSGIDLIRSLRSDPHLSVVPTMLVSNYADSQAEAVSLGALAGFGKADLGRPRAIQALAPLLKPSETS